MTKTRKQLPSFTPHTKDEFLAYIKYNLPNILINEEFIGCLYNELISSSDHFNFETIDAFLSASYSGLRKIPYPLLMLKFFDKLSNSPFALKLKSSVGFVVLLNALHKKIIREGDEVSHLTINNIFEATKVKNTKALVFPKQKYCLQKFYHEDFGQAFAQEVKNNIAAILSDRVSATRLFQQFFTHSPDGFDFFDANTFEDFASDNIDALCACPFPELVISFLTKMAGDDVKGDFIKLNALRTVLLSSINRAVVEGNESCFPELAKVVKTIYKNNLRSLVINPLCNTVSHSNFRNDIYLWVKFFSCFKMFALEDFVNFLGDKNNVSPGDFSCMYNASYWEDFDIQRWRCESSSFVDHLVDKKIEKDKYEPQTKIKFMDMECFPVVILLSTPKRVWEVLEKSRVNKCDFGNVWQRCVKFFTMISKEIFVDDGIDKFSLECSVVYFALYSAFHNNVKFSFSSRYFDDFLKSKTGILATSFIEVLYSFSNWFHMKGLYAEFFLIRIKIIDQYNLYATTYNVLKNLSCLENGKSAPTGWVIKFLASGNVARSIQKLAKYTGDLLIPLYDFDDVWRMCYEYFEILSGYVNFDCKTPVLFALYKNYHKQVRLEFDPLNFSLFLKANPPCAQSLFYEVLNSFSQWLVTKALYNDFFKLRIKIIRTYDVHRDRLSTNDPIFDHAYDYRNLNNWQSLIETYLNVSSLFLSNSVKASFAFLFFEALVFSQSKGLVISSYVNYLCSLYFSHLSFDALGVALKSHVDEQKDAGTRLDYLLKSSAVSLWPSLLIIGEVREQISINPDKFYPTSCAEKVDELDLVWFLLLYRYMEMMSSPDDPAHNPMYRIYDSAIKNLSVKERNALTAESIQLKVANQISWLWLSDRNVRFNNPVNFLDFSQAKAGDVNYLKGQLNSLIAQGVGIVQMCMKQKAPLTLPAVKSLYMNQCMLVMLLLDGCVRKQCGMPAASDEQPRRTFSGNDEKYKSTYSMTNYGAMFSDFVNQSVSDKSHVNRFRESFRNMRSTDQVLQRPANPNPHSSAALSALILHG